MDSSSWRCWLAGCCYTSNLYTFQNEYFACHWAMFLVLFLKLLRTRNGIGLVKWILDSYPAKIHTFLSVNHSPINFTGIVAGMERLSSFCRLFSLTDETRPHHHRFHIHVRCCHGLRVKSLALLNLKWQSIAFKRRM